MKVECFNIKYNNRTTYLSLDHRNLDNFVNQGYLSCYNGSTAPTELEVEVDIRNSDDFDVVESKVKKQLEEDTGLTVISFGFKYACD